MNISPAAGQRIRIEMVRCGYTLESLSETADISPAVLRGILTGRASTVSTRNLCAMARVFGYSAAELADRLSSVE